MLVLDKRTTINGKILTKIEWQEVVDALEVYYIKFYVTVKVYERGRFRTTGTEVSGLLSCTLFVYDFLLDVLTAVCYSISHFYCRLHLQKLLMIQQMKCQ